MMTVLFDGFFQPLAARPTSLRLKEASCSLSLDREAMRTCKRQEWDMPPYLWYVPLG